MKHVYYQPPAPLDRYIEFMWAAEGYVAKAPRERILPSGAQELVIHLSERPMFFYAEEEARRPSETSGAVISGARQSPLMINTDLGSTVGVHFKPGGASLFFNVSAEEMSGLVVSLEDLWGSAIRSLREQLMELASPREQVRILEAFLLARAGRSFEVNPALAISLDAFEDPHLSSVAEVNRRTGFSPKRLAQLFREAVGLTPKSFWRVRRFRAAVRALDLGVLGSADLACEHGYFDQPHFLREFRALAGSTPRQYLAARVPGTDHVSVYG